MSLQPPLKASLSMGDAGHDSPSAIPPHAIAPQFAVENIGGIEFVKDYTILVQHWGFTVGLIGIMMVVAAFRPAWVVPILIIATVEKAFIVYLTLSNARQSFAEGFWAPATMDTVLVLYFLLYFWSLRAK